MRLRLAVQSFVVALVVVVRSSLSGGVTTLALDAHGKGCSGYLLGLSVPWTTKCPAR